MSKFRYISEDDESTESQPWSREEIKVVKDLIKRGFDETEPTKIKEYLSKFAYDKEEISNFYYLLKNNVVDGEFDPSEIPDRSKNWEEFDPEQIALAIFLDVEPFEIEETRYTHYGLNQYDVDGDSYAVGDDYESERAAIQAAESGIDEGLVNPNFVSNYISMSETDRRLYAQEEADYIVDENMSDDEIIERAGIEDKIDEIDDQEIRNLDKINELQTEIEDLESELEDLDANDDEERIGEINNLVLQLQSQIESLEDIDYDELKENLIDDAKDDVRDEIYDEIYDELDDPIEYFVENKGIYTLEELIKSGPVFVDEDQMAKDMVTEDGRGHFLAGYDGDENEQDFDGVTYYIYRVN